MMEFPAVADAPARRRKLGEVVAERIVAEIIERGWCTGDMLGTEADFIERYRISRATFREAVRQLEWRGAACMRRGASGGLVVDAPPRLAAISAIKAYFAFARISHIESEAAATVLRQARPFNGAAGENGVIALFLEALDDRPLITLSEQRQNAGTAPKLGERITLALIRDIQAAGAVPGMVLGNEAGLQQRFGISRAILREALRPLELHDVVRVKAGAQGGVVVHQVDPAYTIDIGAMCLAYARIPFAQTWEAHSSLTLASVEQLLLQETIPAARLKRALTRLEAARASHYLVSVGELHYVIADSCGNRVIALFVRILLQLGPSVLPRPDPRALPALKDGHRRLVEAVEARDAVMARQEVFALYEHARRWIRKVEPDATAATERRFGHLPAKAAN